MTHGYEEALTEFNWADGINDNANRGLTKKTKLAIKSALQLVMDSGWRPIESAPRDGTYILVWQEGVLEPSVTVCSFDDDWWYCCDGKNPELPLRGPAPVKWQPIQPPEASE